MHGTCGYFHIKDKKNSFAPFMVSKKTSDILDSKKLNTKYKECDIYTSYFGKKNVKIMYENDDNMDEIYLQMYNDNSITIKIINYSDIVTLFGSSGIPGISYLSKMIPYKISLKENEEIYNKIIKLKKLKEIKEIKDDTDMLNILDEELNKLYSKNLCIDVYYNTIKYLEFIKETIHLDNVTETHELISICNVSNFDETFFTGSYMIFGGNYNSTYPLGTSDVIIHELTHGLTQTVSGLEYDNESGAINESYSDILASAFKYWSKQNDIYIIGNGFRNMKDPNLSLLPQPCKYKDKFWDFTSDDNGGVHTNSGPLNKLYYLISKDKGVIETLIIFYNLLVKLSKNTNYSEINKIIRKHNKDITPYLQEINLT